jgi:hypothetical protein
VIKGASRLLVTAIVLVCFFDGVASADISNTRAGNVEQGNNRSRQRQDGADASGDAIGGQVSGITSAGTTTLDAHNVSTDVIVDTGDAESSNDAGTFVGHDGCPAGAPAATDITNVVACTVQEGGDRSNATQSANASSGDAVGGQVIAAVVSTDASADIVTDNTTASSDIDTGDALALNDLRAFVGQRDHARLAETGDIRNARADIVQEGDNRLGAVAHADATSGTGVAGQVVGLVSAGRAVIDARNLTREADVVSGVAQASNDESVFVGLEHDLFDATADLNSVVAFESQQGDNRADLRNDAGATSGTALAGQISGIVVAAGGSVDAVLDETGLNSTAASGNTTFSNAGSMFVGLRFATGVPD